MPSENFKEIVELLQCTTKKDLTRHANRITIRSEDLAAMIVGAQHGAFNPYKYANYFERYFPPDSMPTDRDADALAANGVGLLSPEAKKFVNKIFHLHDAQRAFAAHLLYTPNFRYWHLFFFDNRDKKEDQNHWKEGPHIHYTSDLFGLKLVDIWPRVCAMDTTFKKLHIRYKDTA